MIESMFNSQFRKLMVRGMTEFSNIFDLVWTKDAKNHAGKESSGDARPSGSVQGTSNTQYTNTGKGGKRSAQDRDSLPPDERGDNDKKRPRINSSTSSTSKFFACPYHKHDPQKYGTSNRRYRLCVITRYKCLSSVK